MINYIKVIKEDEFITSEWMGGKTTQMFIYPNNSNYKTLDFKWRISSAIVELEESEFTKLEGVNRFITPLNRELTLTHDFSNYIKLNPYDIYEFDGRIGTHSSSGKVVDFNLMMSNGARGNLIKEDIEGETIIKILHSHNKYLELFEAFYSYEARLTITINKEEILLNPNELLIINMDDNEIEVDMKIKSEYPTSILRATISI